MMKSQRCPCLMEISKATEIQWKAFSQVENLVSTIGKELDSDMPASVAAYNKAEKAGTTSKEQKVAVKANRCISHWR